MKIVTAPNNPPSGVNYYVKVFLAGGITGCRNWQETTIEILKQYEKIYDLGNLLVFNPRRPDFDIGKNDEEIEQIKWEHKWLNKCNIVSYFFDNSESVQPITLYELGRYTHKKKSIITVTEGYKRQNDVLIQTALDGLYCNIADEQNAIFQHAIAIAQSVNSLEVN